MGDGGLTSTPRRQIECAPVLDAHFPFYLSIGMTYDQYWREDSQLVKAYREADRLRQKRANRDAWMQGAYFYHALCDVSPILRAFAGKDAVPAPYLEQPFALTHEEIKAREDKLMRERAEGFAAFVAEKNRQAKQKEKEAAEHDNRKSGD